MQVGQGMSPEDIQRMESALFFERPQMRARLIRFCALIIFSSIIATGGLLGDSTAAVIGAMIIAPLMTPMMAVVVGIILGDNSRAVRSFIILTAGIGMAIGVGWTMGRFMPGGWDVTTSSEVMSRTSPQLLDLVIALAAGGAGAYALSRPDIADSLPGVAISISLVPPLNAVGVLLAANENSLANGALLLFITNMAAIFLAGSLMFVATGLATGSDRKFSDFRGAFIAIVIFTIAVAIPLWYNSEELWTDVNKEDDAIAVAEEWLGGTDWEIYETNVDGNELELVVGGSEPLPPGDDALAEIQSIMGDDFQLTVRVLEVRKEVFTGPDAEAPGTTQVESDGD